MACVIIWDIKQVSFFMEECRMGLWDQM
jgi:hypothetical protein